MVDWVLTRLVVWISEIFTLSWNLVVVIVIICLILLNCCYYCILLLIVEAIDCFKCVSYNGANRACDDPFHNNYSTTILESPCMGGRKGRNGLFPATACIKIAGYYGNKRKNQQSAAIRAI